MIFPKVFLYGYGYSIMGSIAIALLLGGIAGKILMPMVIDMKLKEMLPFVNGSQVYEKTTKDKIPALTNFYFFNVTNPEEVRNGGKPILKEIGPIVFNMERQVDQTEFVDDETKLKYCEKRYFYYKEELSKIKAKDTVTIINVPWLTTIDMAVTHKDEFPSPSLIKTVGSILIDNPNNFKGHSDLLMTTNVGDLLFGGIYLDYVAALLKLAKMFGKDFPTPLKNSTFSMLGDRNATCENRYYTIWTGKHDLKKIGDVIEYRNYTEIPYWEDEPCKKLEGKNGIMWGPKIDKSPKITYVDDVCRTTHMEFQKEVEIEGISTYRFEIPKSAWAAPNSAQDRKCYCRKKKFSKNHWCEYSGLYDIAACQMDVPMYLSAPHFYNGDPRLLKMVDGLKPSKEKHECFADVEKITGTPLGGGLRLQMNVEVNRDYFEVLDMTKKYNVQNMIVPFLWFEQNVHLDKASMDLFKGMLTNKLKLANGLIVASIVIGSLLLIVAAIVPLIHRKTLWHNVNKPHKTVS